MKWMLCCPIPIAGSDIQGRIRNYKILKSHTREFYGRERST